MSFICCCPGSTTKGGGGAQPIFLSDLVQNPYKIDGQLEKDIDEWETVSIAYAQYELDCIEKLGIEVTSVINRLRDNPKSVLKNVERDKKKPTEDSEHSVEKLAKMRLKELQMRVAVGLPVRDTKNRDDQDTQGGTFVISEEEEASGYFNSDIANVLSEKWADRLNSMNPTQGALQIESEISTSTKEKGGRKEQREIKVEIQLKIKYTMTYKTTIYRHEI